MVTTIDEFAFPVLISSTGAFIGSPPLWRHVGSAQASSTSSSSSSSEEEQQREHSSYIHSTGDTEGHDTMDLLWESFNEEMFRNRNALECDSTTRNLTKGVAGGARGGDDAGKAVIGKKKKLRVVVLAKVLKRFFLQHQSIKKRSW